MKSAQLMQNATEASRPIPPPVTATILRESFKSSLEILEDSPTEGLIEAQQRKKNYFLIISCLNTRCINYLVRKQLIQF